MAELADALDLGSSAYGLQVQLLSPAPYMICYNGLRKLRDIKIYDFDVLYLREWLSGRASPCQGERREFESRLPLQYAGVTQW